MAELDINNLNEVLKDAVFEIHNLDEYYSNQLQHVIVNKREIKIVIKVTVFKKFS